MKHGEDIILKVEDVGKDYVLGTVTGETLKDALRKRKNESERHNKKFTALDSVSFEVKLRRVLEKMKTVSLAKDEEFKRLYIENIDFV